MDRADVGVARTRLSRDLICETALRLIDESGLESLSMRALACSLGVKASSLYYHFGNKEELLTGVAEALYRKLAQPPYGGDWVVQVKGTFTQLHDFIHAHPRAAPLLVRDLADSPVAKKRANVLLKLLRRAGVAPETSAQLLSNLMALLVGHTLLGLWIEEEVIPLVAEQEKDMSADIRRVWIRKLFPASQAVIPESNASSPADAFFSTGLDALIRGFSSLEGEGNRQSCLRSTPSRSLGE